MCIRHQCWLFFLLTKQGQTKLKATGYQQLRCKKLRWKSKISPPQRSALPHFVYQICPVLHGSHDFPYLCFPKFDLTHIHRSLVSPKIQVIWVTVVQCYMNLELAWFLSSPKASLSLENSLWFSKKGNIEILYDPPVPLLSYAQKNWKHNSTKKLVHKWSQKHYS